MQYGPAIYRGIVPANNLLEHDFAINGAIVSPCYASRLAVTKDTTQMSANNGYTFEVAAHWIASYFRRDKFLDLPGSPGEAIIQAERHNAWLRQRYPGMSSLPESYTGDLTFFKYVLLTLVSAIGPEFVDSWPQTVDTLLEDMGVKSMRSGGNFLTWAFKPIDIKEIEHLTEERDEKRMQEIALAC